MVRRIGYAAAAIVAAGLAACGSSGSGGSSSTMGSTAASGKTVAVQDVGGMKGVLVDAQGNALYAADQEADGRILCTSGSGCTSFWMPLAAGRGKPTAADGAGTIGVVKRPDGTRQVSVDGKPLYTFSQDSPGKVTGNGFRDEFGGQRFTWHVATAEGAASSAGESTDTGGGAYGY